MNWYKIAQQQYAPIAIVSYFGDNLGIVFNGGKKYTYERINPDDYLKIKTLLEKRNYTAAQALLRSWGNAGKETEEDKQEMLDELYERGFLGNVIP